MCPFMCFMFALARVLIPTIAWWVIFQLQFTYTHKVFISAKEVMFSPRFVCGFVNLFVNKIIQKVMDGFR